jgi:hypothetical protein
MHRLARLDVGGLAHEPPGRRADQHLAGRGSLLEPRGDVHRVSEDNRVAAWEHGAASNLANDNLARVDADPDGDPGSVMRLEALVESRDPLLDLESGTTGPERVVLVRFRDAEHAHNSVADELLDGAAVTLERRLSRLEVRAHQPEHRLAVHPLGKGGGARQIAEHRGQQPPPLSTCGLAGERGAAALAEARVGVVRRAADRAHNHGGSLHHRSRGRHGRSR